MWIFGYGSLIWRPDFPHLESRPALIRHYVRRFWQGSTDHRGLPGAPGRVVTLIPQSGAHCLGRAFRLAADDRQAILAQLDHREKGGYERLEVEIHLQGAQTESVPGLVYFAGPQNPNFLGEAPVEDIARTISSAHGPSGPNREYVLKLAEALGEMGEQDPHLEAILAALTALGSDDPAGMGG
jgi:cation transport regulator ChaC